MDSLEDLTRRWTAAQPIAAAFISSQIHDFHDAQDVLQDVAAAIAQSFVRYDPLQPFIPWVISIARNKVIDFRRRTAVDRLVFDYDALDHIAAACSELGDESDSLQEALEHCLKRVAGKSRTLLDLRYEEGLASTQIAERLKATVSAIDVALHRLRMALRDCMRDRLGVARSVHE